MTKVQPMKLTEMVSDYPITEEDNLRHIYKTKEASQNATKQERPTNGSPTDPKNAKTPSEGDQLPPEQPINPKSQPPKDTSPENLANNEGKPLETPYSATIDEQGVTSDQNDSE